MGVVIGEVDLYFEDPLGHQVEGFLVGDAFPLVALTDKRMQEAMGTIRQFHHGLPLGTHGTPGPEVVGISVNIHNPAVLYLNPGGAANLTELAAAVHFLIHILRREGCAKQVCFSAKSGRQYSPAHGHGTHLQEITPVYLWDLHLSLIPA